MQRAFVAGSLLLVGSAITASSKSDQLVFVYLRVDPKQDVAILRPMIAPDIGVRIASGPLTLQPHTVLHCQATSQEHAAIVEGEKATVSELFLHCGEHEFVVKGLDFTPSAK